MSSHGIHARRRRRNTAGLIAVLAALASALLLPSPAFAHDELLGTDPAADSSIDALPAEITLTFSGLIDPDGAAAVVEVTDAAGTSLVGGAPTALDNKLTQPIDTSITHAAGAVTVLWKVVSSDGHPISGQFSFSVPAGPDATPSETPSATPGATPSATPSETAIAPVGTATAAPGPAPSGGLGVVAWALIAVVAVAVIGGVVYVGVSFARRKNSPDDGGSPDANR